MEFKKHAYILAVIENLRANSSWTGKTHVQKSMFLINEATPLEALFKFVLYKHGPYSFDIENELEQMKSYAAIMVQPIANYGVELTPSENANLIKKNASLSSFEQDEIARICRFVGSRSVVELEKLATAVWVRNHEGISDTHDVARRINVLKSHISVSDAEEADSIVRNSLTLMPKLLP